MVLNGFIWFRIGPNVGCCEQGNERLGYINGESLEQLEQGGFIDRTALQGVGYYRDSSCVGKWREHMWRHVRIMKLSFV